MPNRSIPLKKGKLVYYHHKGKSSPILFIHGAGSNKSIWTPYIKAFKSHTVIAVDLRNHGLSSNDKPTVKGMVQDCLNIIKKEKLNNLTIMGNSLGSVVGYHVAKKSTKVKKLILVSHYSKEYATLGSLFAPLFILCGAILAILPPFRKRKYQDYYNKDGSFKKFTFPIDLIGTYADKYCFSAADSIYTRAPISTLKKKTLVLHGKYDWMIDYDKIKKQAKKNKKVTYNELDTHHHLLNTRCKHVIKIIKEFIKK